MRSPVEQEDGYSSCEITGNALDMAPTDASQWIASFADAVEDSGCNEFANDRYLLAGVTAGAALNP
ncbi:MAG TPA: hypothetical protein HPP83_05470 [Candidatus Hydrogenedentes bacterium]|nr:hypothetical protein [Candidatus Hydrogenedentota bacterium]